MLARLTQQLLRPAIDHWQGQHSWPVTLLISVVGVTYLYYLALKQLSDLPDVIAIACWVVVGLALLTWQVGGILRAVRLSSVPPSDVSAVYGGYISILVAVVLIAINMMDGITRHMPQSTPGALLSSNLFDVSIDPDKKSITLRGELNYGSNAALEDLLARHPGTERVVFDSIGGQIFAARTIARRIERLGLDTHVEERCYSACTIAFIAGTRRTLGPQGRLGFHRYGYANRFLVQTVDPDTEQQNDLRFFRARGV
ncbi:MAG: hypothetical protein ACR2PI_28690, partial [Hyphomicrobiaceae bacterium]